MIFKNPEPKNLEEWLEMATKGIAAPGRERIAREIGTHYAEAVEGHLADGESEPVAQASALRQLGNAKKARRKFRKEHLTVNDMQWAVGSWNQNYGKMALVTNFFLGLTLFSWVVRADKLQKFALLFFIPIFLGEIVTQIFAFRQLRQLGSTSKLSSMTLMNGISFSNILLVQTVQATLSFFAVRQKPDHPFFELAQICSIMVSLLWILTVPGIFRTWKKIRRIENHTAVGT